MDLIVAVDNNWAIGNKGDLLVSIPEDHKFFRQTTMGNVVVLGRKTLAGFPNGLPLAGRDNIILSTDPNYTVRGGREVIPVKAQRVGWDDASCGDFDNRATGSCFITSGTCLFSVFVLVIVKAILSAIEQRIFAVGHLVNVSRSFTDIAIRFARAAGLRLTDDGAACHWQEQHEQQGFG
jgi:dihydrofolate reductase